MIAPLLLLVLGAVARGQQSTTLNPTSTTSQLETEEETAKPDTGYLYPLSQVSYNSYQPAPQQQRPSYRQPEVYSYRPYAFDYVAHGEDGSSSRQETSDGNGRVTGSYTLAVEDGRRRVVDYVADQNGFRATVDTNEPGTDVQSPADVVFHSAGATGYRARPDTYRPDTYRPVQQPAAVYRPTARVYSQPSAPLRAAYRPYYQAVRQEGHYPYYNDAYNRMDDHHHGAYNRPAHGSYYSNDYRYHW